MSWYFPTHLYVETSDYCNRRCAYCPIQRDRPPGAARRLDAELFSRLLDELAGAPRPVQLSLQWIDEPLSNPDFFDYAARARARLPDARLNLQTNGDFLDAAGLERLRELFDAVVINFYAEAAYERFVAAGHSYVPARFKRRLQNPGRLLRAPGFEGRPDRAVVHLNQKFADERWVQWHEAVQVPSARRCLRPWVQAAVAFDGQVYLCCRDNHRAHPVGSLVTQSLVEAFNSPQARALRGHMEDARRHDITMCKTCPNAFTNAFDALGSGPGPSDARAEGRGLPYGRYDYLHARAWAKALGHVALPGIEPCRYEYVVGLTPALRRGIVQVLLDALGAALIAIFVAGSRVMTRTRLFEVDKAPFEDPDDPLEIGTKDALRIFGPDPALSSDLDLKVLVDEAAVDEARAEALAGPLGARLEALDDSLPLSGHEVPRLALHRVPGDLAAGPAFEAYDDSRLRRFGRGRLSRQYVQLLFDPRRPEATADPFAAVTAKLSPPDGEPMKIEALSVPPAGPDRFRRSWAGLSYHQLVMALLDFPDLEPAGVRVDQHGYILEGVPAVWAAAEAGRSVMRAIQMSRTVELRR